MSPLFLDVLREIPVNITANKKRKDNESSDMEPAVKKRAAMISNAVVEKLKKENTQLKKEIQMFKDHWMRRFSLFYSLKKMFAFRSANRCCCELFRGNWKNPCWCSS